MPSSKRSRKGEIHFTFREALRKDRKKRKRSSFLYETPKKKNRPRFCSCNKPDDGRKYWLCDKCNIWFHPTCLGLKEDVEPEIFYCKSCQVIQINSDEDTADVRMKKPRGAFSDISSDDSDEGTKKDKIDGTFIESKSSQVKQLLKDILSCDNNDCNEHSHIRHYEFIQNSVIFSIRSKRKYSYGTDYFKTKTMEDLQSNLVKEYLYSISDPKYPVPGAIISLIRHVKEGTSLYGLLTDKKLIALDYICHVLAKEVLTLLVALKSGMPLELANEKCKATERDMRQDKRKR